MKVFYNDKGDVLYIRLDDKKHRVINKRIADNIVLDIGEKERLIGIEIMDASKYLDLSTLFPIKYSVFKKIRKNMAATSK